MSFDLQILVPVIPKRLQGFKKYGLYNIGEKKVLLHCLIGTNDEEIYKNGWPDNVEIKIIKNSIDNPMVQIYSYLSTFTLDQACCADWFCKIDDDSYNDISNLVDHLNKFYDLENDYYVVAQLRRDMNHAEIDALKKTMLFDDIDRNFSHELEGCWLSKNAISKIIKNENCKKLFEFRVQNTSGHTDQCLGAAAKLCKIYPIEEKRFSVDRNSFSNCSIFGGNVFHFHPLCKDKNETNWNIISNYRPSIL